VAFSKLALDPPSVDPVLFVGSHSWQIFYGNYNGEHVDRCLSNLSSYDFAFDKLQTLPSLTCTVHRPRNSQWVVHSLLKTGLEINTRQFIKLQVQKMIECTVRVQKITPLRPAVF